MYLRFNLRLCTLACLLYAYQLSLVSSECLEITSQHNRRLNLSPFTHSELLLRLDYVWLERRWPPTFLYPTQYPMPSAFGLSVAYPSTIPSHLDSFPPLHHHRPHHSKKSSLRSQPFFIILFRKLHHQIRLIKSFQSSPNLMGFGSVVVEKFTFLCFGTDKVITLDPWHVTPLFLYHWRDPSNTFLSNPWSPWSNIMLPTKPFIVVFHPPSLFQLCWSKTLWNGTSSCSYQFPSPSIHLSLHWHQDPKMTIHFYLWLGKIFPPLYLPPRQSSYWMLPWPCWQPEIHYALNPFLNPIFCILSNLQRD